jgi:hypothetical protein
MHRVRDIKCRSDTSASFYGRSTENRPVRSVRRVPRADPVGNKRKRLVEVGRNLEVGARR